MSANLENSVATGLEKVSFHSSPKEEAMPTNIQTTVLLHSFCILVRKKVKSLKSCLTLCDPMDCSLSGFYVHGIFQARILGWFAISFSRRSSWPRDWTRISLSVSRCFTVWGTREVHYQDFNQELPDVQAGFRDAEEAEIRLPTFTGSWWEQGSCRKHLILLHC